MLLQPICTQRSHSPHVAPLADSGHTRSAVADGVEGVQACELDIRMGIWTLLLKRSSAFLELSSQLPSPFPKLQQLDSNGAGSSGFDVGPLTVIDLWRGHTAALAGRLLGSGNAIFSASSRAARLPARPEAGLPRCLAVASSTCCRAASRPCCLAQFEPASSFVQFPLRHVPTPDARLFEGGVLSLPRKASALLCRLTLAFLFKLLLRSSAASVPLCSAA